MQPPREILERKKLQPRRDAATGVIEMVGDRGANLGGIRWIDERAELAVEQRFAAAVVFAADHRNAGGHRFEKDEAESFAAARHRVDVGEIVEIGFLRFVEESCEDDLSRQSRGR